MCVRAKKKRLQYMIFCNYACGASAPYISILSDFHVKRGNCVIAIHVGCEKAAVYMLRFTLKLI